MLEPAVADSETFLSPVARRRLRSSSYRAVLVGTRSSSCSFVPVADYYWRHCRFTFWCAFSGRGDEASHSSVYPFDDKGKLQYTPLSTVLVLVEAPTSCCHLFSYTRAFYVLRVHTLGLVVFFLCVLACDPSSALLYSYRCAC